MLFKKTISFYECKDYFIMNSRELKPTIQDETNSTITFVMSKGKRSIKVCLKSIGNKILVDITDSFYLLRIPQETFSDIKKYKPYILQIVGKLYDELEIEK